MFHYSEEGLKLTQEDSSERVVEEYSGMDNISGMYKRTTYDKERKTTTVEYAYVGSEAIIGRYNENFAQMEQAYKQACKDNRVSNKEKWQQMQQGPKITLNKMREMARNLKGAKREALRAGNKLNENKEQISQII